MPRMAPRANSSRQPTSLGSSEAFSTGTDSSAANVVPSQNDPFTTTSTVPRSRAGISSSMAEFTAAYSPPMPVPVTIRQAKNQIGEKENAVATVASR